MSLVTDVDTTTARALVDAITNEVVVRNPAIHDVAPGATIGYDDAVRLALADRAKAEGAKAEGAEPKRDPTSEALH